MFAGVLRRFGATKIPPGSDIALLRGLRGLREVELAECHSIKDLAPLAHVPALRVD